MKKLTTLFGIIVFSLVIFGVVEAAEKFAFVNLGRVFSEYGKTKDYYKVLEGKQNSYETERDKKTNEIKQLQEKMNLLSEKEKESKKIDLENKIKGLKDFDNQKQADLRKEEYEKSKELLKDIEETIKQYGEKEGCTLVFDDRFLIYQSKNLDITDKIINILNTKTTKK